MIKHQIPLSSGESDFLSTFSYQGVVHDGKLVDVWKMNRILPLGMQSSSS